MNPLAMYPEHRREELIRERNQQLDGVSTFHPVANVLGRLLLWLALTFATLVVWFNAVLSTLSFGASDGPPPEPDQMLVTAIPVLFVLSLLSLLGPGSSGGLRLFGLIWASIVGAMVVSATLTLW